jgi:hypothetical protein
LPDYNGISHQALVFLDLVANSIRRARNLQHNYKEK